MDIKIKSNLKLIYYYLAGIALIATYFIARDVIKNYNFRVIVTGAIILAIYYLILLFIFVLVRYGIFVKITGTELSVTKSFISEKYPLKNIKKIREVNHFYFGPILVIDFLDKNNQLKTKIMFAIREYKPEDIKKLLSVLHEKNPDIELPQNWL